MGPEWEGPVKRAEPTDWNLRRDYKSGDPRSRMAVLIGSNLRGELQILLLGAPVDEIGGVKGDAKEIGGHETELRGADADHTDDGAIEGGNNPALPEFFAN